MFRRRANQSPSSSALITHTCSPSLLHLFFIRRRSLVSQEELHLLVLSFTLLLLLSLRSPESWRRRLGGEEERERSASGETSAPSPALPSVSRQLPNARHLLPLSSPHTLLLLSLSSSPLPSSSLFPSARSSSPAAAAAGGGGSAHTSAPPHHRVLQPSQGVPGLPPSSIPSSPSTSSSPPLLSGQMQMFY